MTDLFNQISYQNKQKLLRLLEADTLNCKKDQTILSIIKNDNFLGIILTGCIQIIRTDHNGIRTIIEELEENDVFGSTISSLQNSEYDIITKEDTEIILIDYRNIINCKENNKSFYNQFIKNLLQITTAKIKDKNERIEILTKKTIRNKLLEYFKIISNKHGSKYIYLPFNFTDLADYLAIDRSAMSRELKYLKEEGLIEVKGKRITLLYDKFI
ncbi:MAG: Crp/Fnr family transcriptional regulator [Bacilli bacterium]|nr:Crp/Fnr family transcriptional regulator [Bacilli bacterium]